MADGDTDFNLDDYPGEGEGDQGASGAGSNNFAEVRKYARKQERLAKELASKVEELTAFQAEVLQERKATTLDTVFKEVGLSPKHAALFAKVNPEADVTADTVKAFAAEYDLATVGEEIVAPERDAEGITPIVKGSGGTSPAAGQKVSSAEWLGLQTTDPARAKQLFEKGMVDMSTAMGAGTGLYHDLA